MKVAVISQEQMSGKSCFIATLAGVYSRSQHQNVSILSTGDAEDNMAIVDTPVRSDDIANMYVFKSVVESAEKGDLTLLNYGVKQGGEHVYIYNIMNCAMDQHDKEELFLSAMDRLPSRLTLVEICGPIDDPFTQDVLFNSDCILLLLDTSIKSFKNVGAFVDKMPEVIRGNVGYVISKTDPMIAGDKAIEKLTGIKISHLYKYPYNPVIAKLAFKGNLNAVAYDICVADSTVVDFRMKMQEVMEFIFNTSQRKIVRSIDKWYK